MDFHNIRGQIDFFWPIVDQVLIFRDYDKKVKMHIDL